MTTALNKRCQFETDRLWVAPFGEATDFDQLVQRTIDILTPEVTRALPPGWQQINDLEKAAQWLNGRHNESTFLLVKLKADEGIIGFIFLYEEENNSAQNRLRFGYLLSEEVWGKGIGTELLRGFIEWCKADGQIESVSGGVEQSNIGSIKVLEKVGFKKLPADQGQADTIYYSYRFK